MTYAGAQTILVVDDEADILAVISQVLAESFKLARILTASSGAEAIELLEHESVQVILSDFSMPGMDGVEFLRQSRGRAPAAARILMSAYPELDASVAELNEARITVFLPKPLDPDELVATVAAGLETRRGLNPHI